MTLDHSAAAPGTTLRFPWTDPPEPGTAIPVADDVLWMRLPLPMVLDHVNVFALADDDGWTLVDTGLNSAKSRAIWQVLLDGPLAGRPVRRVICTHHHPDHIGLAGWFQRDHGAELIMTRTAWLLGRMLQLDDQDRPTPETLAFWRAAGMAPDLLAARAGERPFNFADVVAPMPVGFTRMRAGECLRFGGRDWVVRTGDGHAPEQATLWSRADDLVLGGDLLLATISPNIGVYATEPDANPLGEWLASCQALQGHARDAQLVLPGHKLPFHGAPLRLRQLIDNHEGALERLRAHLRQPRLASECFFALFKRTIGPGEYGHALVEAVAHINFLKHSGEIDAIPRPDGAVAWRMKDAPRGNKDDSGHGQ